MRSESRSKAPSWREPVGHGLRRAGTLLLIGSVGVCPLLGGSVHKPALIAILFAVSLAFVGTIVGEGLRGRTLRGPQFSVFFILFVLIPLMQLVPLPSSVRGTIDPAGLALLENASGGIPHSWPLSLDPQATRNEIGVAAATLGVFLLALHGASGRRHRMLVLHAIAVAGVLAVISALAHRIFGIDRLYGLFSVDGAVLPGPFINPNHSAEFYELTAFSALALAMATEREVRVGWFVAAGVSAAAALTTLSRGAMLALLAGGAVFVLLRLGEDGSGSQPGSSRLPPRARKTIGWGLFALGCLAAAAVALGASPLFDEVANTNLFDGNEKIIVWKDSLPLVTRHPLGIGRHAFDRVFPAYKTLPLNTRFEFVENGPLQLLIDLGWPGFAALAIALIWLARRLQWRRDDVGVALFAGLLAVVAHNLVDFGLETLGIRLLFAAMAGVAIGRVYGRNPRDQRTARPDRRVRLVATATVGIGLVVGLTGQFQVDAEQLEERWKRSGGGEQRRRFAVQGGERFPTDFFFPLLQSYDEPLRPGPSGGPSPRLAALNRAMRLCPTCPVVHEQAARALRRLGRRAQALSSFRDTVRLAPNRLATLLGELDVEGYAPTELATLAVGNAEATMAVARFLIPKGKQAESAIAGLIRLAREQGVSQAELLLLKADLSVALERYGEARAALTEVGRLSPRDGRSYAALANLAEKEGNLDMALEQARAATTMSPFVAEFARRRLGLVLLLHRWSELDEALERLKIALRQNGQNVTEVHMVAGQTHQSRGNLGRALSEFQMAATLDVNNPVTWAAVGRVSEERGDLSGAAEAYQRAATLRPNDPEFVQAIARVEKGRADSRLRQLLP